MNYATVRALSNAFLAIGIPHGTPWLLLAAPTHPLLSGSLSFWMPSNASVRSLPLEAAAREAGAAAGAESGSTTAGAPDPLSPSASRERAGGGGRESRGWRTASPRPAGPLASPLPSRGTSCTRADWHGHGGAPAHIWTLPRGHVASGRCSRESAAGSLRTDGKRNSSVVFVAPFDRFAISALLVMCCPVCRSTTRTCASTVPGPCQRRCGSCRVLGRMEGPYSTCVHWGLLCAAAQLGAGHTSLQVREASSRSSLVGRKAGQAESARCLS